MSVHAQATPVSVPHPASRAGGLRILYVCSEYSARAGGSTHAREFGRALSGLEGVAALEIYPPPSRPCGAATATASPRRLPPSVRRLMRAVRPHRRLAQRIAHKVRQERFDAVVLRTDSAVRLPARLRALLPEVPLCLEVNAALFDELFARLPLRGLWQRYEVAQMRRGDCVTVVSGCLREYLLRRGMPQPKILVNPNGVNPDLFTPPSDEQRRRARAQLGLRADAFVLAYSGGMERFRRLPQVVRTVARLRAEGYSDLALVVMGDGEDMPAVRQAVADAAPADGLVLTGRVPYETVPGLLAAADVGLFPFSNPYGSPQKLFEYLAMGIATIGPDVPAVRETFIDGRHLLLVGPDGAGLAQAILRLRGDSALRGQLAQAGRRHVLERFTWRDNAMRVWQRLRELACAGGAALPGPPAEGRVC